MALTIILADVDWIYCSRVSDWFQIYGRKDIRLLVVTKLEPIKTAMADMKENVFILIAGSMQEILCESLKTIDEKQRNQIVLLDDGYKISFENSMKTISKYQSMKQFFSEVYLFLGEQGWLTTNKPPISKMRSTIVFHLAGDMLYQPMGPVWATVCSAARKKTLYLPLSHISALQQWFSSEKANENMKGLNELVYYLNTSNENITHKLNGCISKDKNTSVFYVKESNDFLDSVRLGAENFLVINEAAAKAGFEEIIYDMGHRIDSVTIGFSELCHRIVFVGTESQVDSRTMKNCFSFWNSHCKALDDPDKNCRNVRNEASPGIKNRRRKVMAYITDSVDYGQMSESDDGLYLVNLPSAYSAGKNIENRVPSAQFVALIESSMNAMDQVAN